VVVAVSTFAQQFNDTARPLLWAQLAEPVVYRDRTGSRNLTAIFKRVNPAGREAEGPEAFHAAAQAVVTVADLPAPDGTALLIRDGVTWAIRHIERQDIWTWILHLAQPTDDLRLPDRIR
jgi:hypothetical protein